MKTDELFKSLATKHLSRAYPKSNIEVSVKIDESKMYITIYSYSKLDRNDIQRVLVPLFQRDHFKDFDKHIKISCYFFEVV